MSHNVPIIWKILSLSNTLSSAEQADAGCNFHCSTATPTNHIRALPRATRFGMQSLESSRILPRSRKLVMHQSRYSWTLERCAFDNVYNERTISFSFHMCFSCVAYQTQRCNIKFLTSAYPFYRGHFVQPEIQKKATTRPTFLIIMKDCLKHQMHKMMIKRHPDDGSPWMTFQSFIIAINNQIRIY